MKSALSLLIRKRPIIKSKQLKITILKNYKLVHCSKYLSVNTSMLSTNLNHQDGLYCKHLYFFNEVPSLQASEGAKKGLPPKNDGILALEILTHIKALQTPCILLNSTLLTINILQVNS